MALDEFTDGDEELNLEDMEIDFRPYNAEVEQGTQVIYSAATLIQDQMVVVELDEPIERSIMEQGNTDIINQKVAQQLAQDHLWNRLNHDTVMVEEGEHEQILDHGTELLGILYELYHQRLATRSDLEQGRGEEIRHDQMKSLENKKLVSHVGKDGRAYIYTVTPRGAAELLVHDDYEELNQEVDRSEGDSEELEGDDAQVVQADIEDEL